MSIHNFYFSRYDKFLRLEFFIYVVILMVIIKHIFHSAIIINFYHFIKGFTTPLSRPTSVEPPNRTVGNSSQVSNVTTSNGGLRRVCSLSDLTKQGSGRRMLPAPPLTGMLCRTTELHHSSYASVYPLY